MDRGEKVMGGFVIAGGDGAVLFEFTEEVLNEMAGLVEFSVIRTLNWTVGLGRDDGGFSSPLSGVDDPPIGVVALVGQKGIGFQVR